MSGGAPSAAQMAGQFSQFLHVVPFLFGSARGQGRLPFIHVKDLGDDVPGAVELDEGVEVGVVGADRVPFPCPRAPPPSSA